MEDDHKKLIEWARSAPIGHVAEVRSYIRRFDSAEAVSDPDQPAEPAVT